MSIDQQSAGATVWCCGFPCTGRFPLEQQEILTLKRRQSRATWLGILYTIIAPVSFIIFFALLLSFGNNAYSEKYFTYGIFISLAIIGALFCLGNDVQKRAKLTKADINAGHYLRFSGVETAHIFHTQTQQHLFGRYMKKNVQLDILPASGRIYRINGELIEKWHVVPRTEVAETPEIAGIAANWLDIVQNTDDIHLEAGKRELNKAEKSELTRYARSRWKPMVWVTCITLPWASIILYLCITTRSLPDGSNLMPFLLLESVAIASLYILIKGLVLAKKINDAIRNGYVLILRETPTEKQLTEYRKKNNHDDEPTSVTVEVIPNCDIIWTVDGKVAEWRM